MVLMCNNFLVLVFGQFPTTSYILYYYLYLENSHGLSSENHVEFKIIDQVYLNTKWVIRESKS